MSLTKDYGFVEFFSGSSNVSYALKLAGNKGVSIDVRYTACFDVLTDAGFALCVVAVLRMKPGGLAVLAPVCSSFSGMSRHQSGRSARRPEGDELKLWVRDANIMTARVVLLMQLCQALQLPFILEQPGGSSMEKMPRFLSLRLNTVLLFVCSVWMRAYGHMSMKRTLFYSNTNAVLELAVAKVSVKDRLDLEPCL